MVVVAATALAGCQVKPPSDYLPVPLPMALQPSSSLTVVGTGDTAEAAREAALQQLAREVILPSSEPENAPTAEFVQNMIRGYDVTSVTRDFLGKYYVTVELTLRQLGTNYQELYHVCRTHAQESEALRKDAASEENLRRLAEERATRAAEQLAAERKAFEDRMLVLQAQNQQNEARVRELANQRLKDEKAMKALEEQLDTLTKERDALKKAVDARGAAPAK
jgi:hypothetical protein